MADKRAMPHTYTSLCTHVTFATAGRRPLLSDDLRARVHAYLAGITRELKARPITVGGVSDHVHMLIESPPSLALSELMRVVKGSSSKWIGETFGKELAWQRGFGAFSVSRSNVESVVAYILNQEQHRRTRTFEEEFKALLAANGIDCDPRYLWT